MHRFHLPPERCRGDSLQLDGREAHHAVQVLRVQRGEEVTVLDGAGTTFLCEVESATKHSVTLVVQERKASPAPSCAITLFVAIPKGKIIEDIIEKAVELGAQRIVPLLTERVVTHLDNASAEQKREKWQQVAVEAIKQCGAAWLPKLSLVGSLQTERRHPRVWLEEFQRQHGRLPQSAGVWIGPEGDFTLAELQAIEATGAKPITLGSLTLRVETAAIYCLSFLNYELSA